MPVGSFTCAPPLPAFRTSSVTRDVWRRCLALFLLTCLALACYSPPSADPPSGSLSLFSLEDVTLRLAESPSLVVGDQAALPLDRVGGAVFFGDGLAIANGGTNQILVLDSGGERVASWGRTGSGPGEYRWLSGIARHGDGLVLWDETLRRLTRLDSQGRYLGSVSGDPAAVGTGPSCRRAGRHGPASDLVPGLRGEGTAGPTVIRHPEEFLLVDLPERETLPAFSSMLGGADGSLCFPGLPRSTPG